MNTIEKIKVLEKYLSMVKLCSFEPPKLPRSALQRFILNLPIEHSLFIDAVMFVSKNTKETVASKLFRFTYIP